MDSEGAKYQDGANDVAKNHDIENAKPVYQKIRHYSSYDTTPVYNGNLTRSEFISGFRIYQLLRCRTQMRSRAPP